MPFLHGEVVKMSKKKPLIEIDGIISEKQFKKSKRCSNINCTTKKGERLSFQICIEDGGVTECSEQP